MFMIGVGVRHLQQDQSAGFTPIVLYGSSPEFGELWYKCGGSTQTVCFNSALLSGTCHHSSQFENNCVQRFRGGLVSKAHRLCV